MRRAFAAALVAGTAVPAVFGAGCATAGSRVAANAIDLEIAPVAASPRAQIRSTGEPTPAERCSLTLTVGELQKSSPGCFLDAKVINVRGTLDYPCRGNGPAAADFGDDHYDGRLDDGRLALVRTTELDWEDGCRWGTRAALEGALAQGKPPDAHAVTWTYADRVVSGAGCSGICRAHGPVALSTRATSRAAPKQSTDDDDDD